MPPKIKQTKADKAQVKKQANLSKLKQPTKVTPPPAKKAAMKKAAKKLTGGEHPPTPATRPSRRKVL
jgi:hypothetical protein